MSLAPDAADRSASRLGTIFSQSMGALTGVSGIALLIFAALERESGPGTAAFCLLLLGAGAIGHARFTGPHRRRATVLPILAAVVAIGSALAGTAPGTPAGLDLPPTAVAAFLLLAVAQ